MKIKILHILWSGKSGGAERFVKDIVHYSDKTKFQHAVCFLSQGGRLADEMALGGAEIHTLEMASGWAVRAVIRLFGLIRRCQPKVIHNHSHNYLANAVLLFCKDIRKIFFEHGGSELTHDLGKNVLLYDFFGNRHDLILVNSEFERQRILEKTRAKPEKLKVFHIGIDASKYAISGKDSLKASLGIPSSHKVVCAVGRLVGVKDFGSFLRVAATLQKTKDMPQCSFLIVGEGPLRAQLETQASEFGVDVKFLGDRQDVPRILAICDIFLFTSKWESFGIVVLEAMAAGVPVVGFSGNGASEIMNKGGAILIEDRNIKKAATVIRDILSDPARGRDLGDAGRKNVLENFEVRNSVKKLESIYAALATDCSATTQSDK